MASTQEVKAALAVSIEQVREAQGGAHVTKEAFGELNVASSLEGMGKIGAAALKLATASKELGVDTIEKNVGTAEEAYRAGLKGTENDDVKELFVSLTAAKESLTGTEGVNKDMTAYSTVLEEVGNVVMAGVSRLEQEAVTAVAAGDTAGENTIMAGEQIIAKTEAYAALL